MLTAILPHQTYRRHFARLAARWLQGKASLRPVFDRRNWHHFFDKTKQQLHCNVCGHVGKPFFDFPDLELRHEHRIGELRETLQCKDCGSTMRHRTLAAAMLKLASTASGKTLHTIDQAAASNFAGLRVLDADSFSPIAVRLKHLPNYFISSFHLDRPFDTELSERHFNINLEKIGFGDADFDMVITSDVMEHVRHDELAHSEISRILKPGGSYVFTVPYDENCPTEHKLVDISGNEDKMLVPPQFHGDPLTGGILAYRVYGNAIFSDLAKSGLEVEFMRIDDSAAMILGGDVFVARKKGVVADPAIPDATPSR